MKGKGNDAVLVTPAQAGVHALRNDWIPAVAESRVAGGVPAFTVLQVHPERWNRFFVKHIGMQTLMRQGVDAPCGSCDNELEH